ncbi:Fibroblast growth factor receptor 3 [Hypsibius exemplaris]|uniref:receptor protein-tyrosine kinase n=1 Tax=Hypsibius exemplaris TaxID=2072580 RepID=A0A9X6N9G6_HYPEX|nr:Fibroblast growth factor receptor 3 [Hypsibius exemplaris]
MRLWTLWIVGSVGFHGLTGSPHNRDISVYLKICRLACISLCMKNQQKSLTDCAKVCPASSINSSEECEDDSCLSHECAIIKRLTQTMEFTSGMTSNLGKLASQQSLTCINMNWTVPENIAAKPASQLGPLLFFVEEKDDEGWECSESLGNTLFTQPAVNVTKQCATQRFRLGAVNAGGLVAVSSEAIFYYDDHSIPLPVKNLVLFVKLESSTQNRNNNEPSCGSLNWTLPDGVTDDDVQKYSLRIMVKACALSAAPVVTWVPGTESATVSGLSISCIYESKVFFTTNCGAQSKETSSTKVIRCPSDIPLATCSDKTTSMLGIVQSNGKGNDPWATLPDMAQDHSQEMDEYQGKEFNDMASWLHGPGGGGGGRGPGGDKRYKGSVDAGGPYKDIVLWDGQGAGPPADIVVSIDQILRDGSGSDIAAIISWKPPQHLGSSSKLIGYEIWYGLLTKPPLPAGAVEGYYTPLTGTSQYDGYKVINITDPSQTTCIIDDLIEGLVYGVKVTAIGDVPYNVAQVLPYKQGSIFRAIPTGRLADTTIDNSMALSIGMPVLFIVVLIVGISCCCWRCKRAAVKQKVTLKSVSSESDQQMVYLTPITEPLTLRYQVWPDLPNPPDILRQVLPPRTADRWELPRSRIEIGEVLGRGAFGEVFKAKIMGSILVNTEHSTVEKHLNFIVAIKLLPAHADGREKDAFLQEIQIMKDIGYHRHIVSLIGCCIESDPIFLVEEYCPLGDLRLYLSSQRQAVMTYSATDSGIGENGIISTITLSDLLSYARQIAIGMEYIHRKGYVHRDLAARNILLFNRTHVKIGDFGLTRYIYEDRIYVVQNAGRLPVKWMAIESIFDLTFTSASDVWAFGVVLFELITLGGTPYPTINNKDLLNELKNGYRMECPDNCPTNLYALMRRCWQVNPERRPAFAELQSELERMLESSAGSESYLQLDTNRDYYAPVNSRELILGPRKLPENQSRVNPTFHDEET